MVHEVQKQNYLQMYKCKDTLGRVERFKKNLTKNKLTNIDFFKINQYL